ncbi:hypothetical protein M6D81_21200 [Paenibacillus sp. J5C_2022]|nr:hypothetical protein [Paenibacillus sp. J5C2022]
MFMVVMILSVITLMGCKPDHQDSNTVPTVPTVKKIKSFYPENKGTIERMEILKAGGTRKSITDKEIISKWLDKIGEIDVTLDPSPEDRSGVLYIITLFDKDKEVFRITPHSINHTVIVSNRDVTDRMTELWEEQSE